MTKTSKKILSLLLAAAMTLSLLVGLTLPILAEPGTYSISGFISNDVTGYDISGVTVELYSGGELVGSTTSSQSAGAYVFSGLASGNYTVKVPAGTYGGQYYSENSENVTITDANRWVGIFIMPGNAPGTYSISGCVEDMSEGGVGGATVELYSGGKRVGSTTTNGGGDYFFYSLEPGDYMLRLISQSYIAEDVPVTVYNQDVLEYIIVWRRTFNTVSAKVFTGNFIGVAGVTVNLYRENSEQIYMTTTTDETGRFTFTNVEGMRGDNVHYDIIAPDGIYGGQWYTGDRSIAGLEWDGNIFVFDIWVTPITSTYTATLTVNRDGGAWNGHGKTFTLKRSTDENVTAQMSGANGTLTATVPNGTWKVYDGADDTGVAIIINNAAGNAELDYYTVEYRATDSGTASGSIIGATYDGSAIGGNTVVLGGKTLTLTALGSGTSNYIYLWKGAGTNGEISESITINNLSGAVNAVCIVTGTTSDTKFTSVRPESEGGKNTVTVEYTTSARYPIIIAAYNGNKLVDFVVRYTNEGSPLTADLNLTNANKVVAMIWDDINLMQPLFPAKVKIKIGEALWEDIEQD